MGPTALRGFRATGSNPRPLDYQANVLPLGHGSLLNLLISKLVILVRLSKGPAWGNPLSTKADFSVYQLSLTNYPMFVDKHLNPLNIYLNIHKYYYRKLYHPGTILL